jgi:hypothetical protein
MKGFLLTAISSINFAFLSAQSLPQSYISFSEGISNPLGVFAGTTDPYSQGFAMPGSIVAIDWAKYYKHLGYSATVSLTNHRLNEAALNNALANYDGVPYYSTNNWLSSCAMIGATYGYRLGRLTFDARLMAGAYFAKTPSVRYAHGIELDIVQQAIKHEYATNIGSQAGLSARYNFSKRWFLNVRTNFYYALPYYTIPYPAYKTTYQPEQYNFQRHSTAIDFTVGIGYDLGNLQ